MAGTCTQRDFALSYSPWHVFGPVTASVSAAENAAVSGQPRVTLNFLGSACLAVSTSAAHAWPSAAANLIWLAIGVARSSGTVPMALLTGFSPHAAILADRTLSYFPGQ